MSLGACYVPQKCDQTASAFAGPMPLTASSSERLGLRLTGWLRLGLIGLRLTGRLRLGLITNSRRRRLRNGELL